MDLIIETTKNFEKSISKINTKQKIVEKINLLIDKIENAKFECNKILDIKILNIPIINDIHTNLYLYRITQDYRIIFAVDIDNLFDKVTVTLYGITKLDSYQELVSSIVKFQKQQFGVCDNESR